MAERKRTARYMVMEEAEGTRFRFYCDISGAAVWTTGPVQADSPENRLQLAWDRDASRHFNQCRRCGSWVSDVMFNADVCECVDCSPWEEKPNFCCQCGSGADPEDIFCRKCGTRLRYGEVWT